MIRVNLDRLLGFAESFSSVGGMTSNTARHSAKREVEQGTGRCSVEASKITADSVGAVLRHHLFNKLTPILLSCDKVSDAAAKVLIRDCCKQAVNSLEDIISEYELDSLQESVTESTRGNGRFFITQKGCAK